MFDVLVRALKLREQNSLMIYNKFAEPKLQYIVHVYSSKASATSGVRHILRGVKKNSRG